MFFPLGVQSESAFNRAFAEDGFWQREEGYLSMITPDQEIAGHIEFFKPVIYWDAFELGYQLYDERFADRGYATEAVQLMVDYLFAANRQARIQLDGVPENAASRRVAEKCGFTLEGTARSAIDVTWTGPRFLRVTVPDVLTWDVHLAAEWPSDLQTFSTSPPSLPAAARATSVVHAARAEDPS